MAPSFLTIGTAVLACAGNAAAKKWYLEDTYDASNFFDKFNFFESRFGTGNYNDVDPTSGHVNYQSKQNAFDKGLVAYKGDEVYIGVDTNTTLRGSGYPGRNSVRIESKARFNHGLIVSRFTHLPDNKCGVWPAVWTVGEDWPNDGEIDFYEEWNDSTFNQPAIHTGNSAEHGNCILDGQGQTSSVSTSNCDNTFENPPLQWQNQGCVSRDTAGPWATRSGGIYAMEWTSDYIKLFSWTWGNEPADIDSDSPDTSSWGRPSVWLKNRHCHIDNHFANQRLILNINFCGIPAGLPEFWGQSCAAKTQKATCVDYVSNFPEDFKEVYYQIKDVRYFAGSAPVVSSTTSATSTTSMSSSASSTLSTSTTSTTSMSSSASSTLSTSTTSTTSMSSSASSTLSTSTTSASTTSTASSTSTRSSTSTASTSTSTSATSTLSTISTSSSSTDSTGSTSTLSSSTPTSISSTALESSTYSTPVTSTTSSPSESVTTNTRSTESFSDGTTSTSSGVSATLSASSTLASVSLSSSSPVLGPSSFPTISIPSTTARFANSSVPVTSMVSPTATDPTTSAVTLPSGSLSSGPELTTSTVFTTTVYTITKCPPWVNCPDGGYVTTETIPLYTTVCPVTEAIPTSSAAPPHGAGPTTITTSITSVYTITACPPTVPKCPIGSVTTEVITSTYCPGADETGAPSSPGHGSDGSADHEGSRGNDGSDDHDGSDVDETPDHSDVSQHPEESHDAEEVGSSEGVDEHNNDAEFTAPVPFHPSQTTAIIPVPTVHNNGSVPAQPSHGPDDAVSGAAEVGVSVLAVAIGVLAFMVM